MTTNELCKIITDRVTAEMEKGIIPWERPWTGTTSGAISGATGKPVVNAAYLLDILEALPGSAAEFSTPLAGIHFRADTGTGLLMPVRPAININRQTTDLTI